MHEAEKLSLEQIQAFLSASEAMRFEGETQQQIYHLTGSANSLP